MSYNHRSYTLKDFAWCVLVDGKDSNIKITGTRCFNCGLFANVVNIMRDAAGKEPQYGTGPTGSPKDPVHVIVEYLPREQLLDIRLGFIILFLSVLSFNFLKYQ